MTNPVSAFIIYVDIVIGTYPTKHHAIYMDKRKSGCGIFAENETVFKRLSAHTGIIGHLWSACLLSSECS